MDGSDGARVLTVRELNRALLARQLLLQRARVPVARAVERLGALQAQWPPSPYLALWSRLEGFRREQLERALARRRVVKATLMRQTLHLVSGRDFPDVAAALRRTWVDGGGLRWLSPEVRGVEAARLAERVVAAARERPLTRAQIFELIADAVPPGASEAYPWSLLLVVHAHASLVHTPASSAWRTSGSPAYVPAAAVLGDGAQGDAEAGGALLVRRHLAAFGPATRGDLASWTGIPAVQLAAALDAMPLRTFRDGAGRTLLDLPRAPLPPAATRAPVRFLPKWDSALLAYQPPERVRILPEALRKTVIRKNGDVLPTVLVDGFVAATWRVERSRRAAALVVEPLERLGRAQRRDVEEEGAGLLRFHEPAADRYSVRLAAPA